MTTHRNGFEGQTDGTAVTTANSAASGSAFTSVVPGTGGAITYSNLHPADGAMGIAYAPASGVNCYTEDASYNSTSMVSEYCFWFSGTAPTATTVIKSFRSAAGQHVSINLNTAKQIVIGSSTGGVLSSLTTVLTAGFWRVALQVFSDATAGTVGVQLYSGSQSTTATETKSLTAQNTRGGAMTIIRRGIVSNTVFGGTFYGDSYQAADGTLTPMGPFPVNAAPTASFTHSETGLSTSVNGGASTDSDGTIVSYDWNWGDGTTHGTGATASHTYASAGTRTVTLTVTDNGGATATSTASVTVAAANTPPVANAGVDQTVDAYSTVTLNSSASIDSDGTIASRVWTHVSGPSSIGALSSTTAVSPTYKAPGLLTSGVDVWRVTVTDNAGATNPDDVSITVNAANERAVVGGVEVPMEMVAVAS